MADTRMCFTCGEPLTKKQQKYCGRQCYRNGKGKRLAPRFWGKVQKSEDCWLWTGPRDRAGYGLFAVVGDASKAAHRWSWRLAHGPIGEGMEVCHRCDNPACVNPDHLFLGSHTVNMRDAEHKQRLRYGVHLRKLTDAQHDEIRRVFVPGQALQIGARFGVSMQTVHRIVYGYPAARRIAKEGIPISRAFVRVPHVLMPISGEVW
jgi:hypothetical protein